MYLKLSIRNAKRCMVDYLLYIAAMIILLSIMHISNCIAVMGEVQAGFKTASLPILITIILAVLVGYIDTFMLKQRAKEFANYLLLGMEKNSLSTMFLCEFLIMGIVCFVIGTVLGTCIYTVLPVTALYAEPIPNISLLGRSFLQTFLYFCLVEGLCTFFLKYKMQKLTIRELVYERERNQKIVKKNIDRRWGIILSVNLVCLTGLLCGIVFSPEYIALPSISVIALPLLSVFFVFYQWLFGRLYAMRQKRSASLYQGNRLHMIAQITSHLNTSIMMNSILGVCLFFSACAFFFGMIMLHPSANFFDRDSQQWMGFVQISICIIFIVIYFSVLSVQQIIELKREAKGISILHYIGKNGHQIRSLAKKQLVLRLLMPTVMTFFLLFVSVPLLNLKLNSLLPDSMRNILPISACCFGLCFLLFYLCYFLIIYVVSRPYIKATLSR